MPASTHCALSGRSVASLLAITRATPPRGHHSCARNLAPVRRNARIHLFVICGTSADLSARTGPCAHRAHQNVIRSGEGMSQSDRAVWQLRASSPGVIVRGWIDRVRRSLQPPIRRSRLCRRGERRSARLLRCGTASDCAAREEACSGTRNQRFAGNAIRDKRGCNRRVGTSLNSWCAVRACGRVQRHRRRIRSA